MERLILLSFDLLKLHMNVLNYAFLYNTSHSMSDIYILCSSGYQKASSQSIVSFLTWKPPKSLLHKDSTFFLFYPLKFPIMKRREQFCVQF